MEENDLEIRTATSEDSAGILACLAAAFEPYRDSYTVPAYLDTVLTTETLAERFAAMQVLVAIANCRVVGTIACVAADGGEGHLRGMAVPPQWQGRGVAGQLLRAAEAVLTERGCRRITLDTTKPLERAMKFYEHHGYRRSGKTTDFFGMPLHEYVKEAGRSGS